MADLLDASTASTASTADHCSLPHDLLVLVLQHVPTPHCLGSCAVVSAAWQRAARAATSRVQLRSRGQAITSNLQEWLSSSNGALQVTNVQVLAGYHSVEPDLQLAEWRCPRLQELTLSSFTLTRPQPAAKGGEDTFAAFSRLTRLSLQFCCIQGLASLAAIKGLKHLRLEKPRLPGLSPAAAAACTLDAGPLAALRLTSLHIIKGQYKQLLESVCSLTGLLELHLVRCKDTDIAAEQLWHLVGLTSLRVEAVPGLHLRAPSSSSSGGGGSSSSRRRLAPLQQLQVLELTAAAGFDPLLLATALQLTRLHLTSTPLAPGGAAGTAALLSVLRHMTALDHLNLRGTLQHAVGPAQAAAGGVAAALYRCEACYAGLTASSRLQFLDLSRCALPPEAALAMFAASSTQSSSTTNSSSAARLPRLQQLLLADTLALTRPADLAALVAGCPRLCHLELTGAFSADTLPPGMLTMLGSSRLEHLCSLLLRGVDDAAAQELAQLTQLETLSITWPSSITDAGVQRLTSLRRLRQLWVHGDVSSRLAPGYLISMASSTGSPPDIWCQLREACQAVSLGQQHSCSMITGMPAGGGAGPVAE